jgi:hypothetical protein
MVKSMSDKFSLAIDDATTGANQPGLLVKLSCATSEVNVWFTSNEAVQFTKHWDAGTLSGQDLGQSAGLPVLWSLDDEAHVHLLLGGDNTTWDIGFTLPATTVDALAAAFRSRSPKPV